MRSGSAGRTETTSLDIALLPRRRVRICITYGGPGTLWQVLVEAPLLRARETRLARVVGRGHWEDRIVRAEAYACNYPKYVHAARRRGQWK